MSSLPSLVYIKVHYKSIIKKIKVQLVSEVTIESIWKHFSSFSKNEAPTIYCKDSINQIIHICNDDELRNAIQIILNTNTEQSKKFRLFFTDEKIEFQKMNRKYSYHSQGYKYNKSQQSIDIFHSMMEIETTKLRKISQDLSKSRLQLQEIKKRKRSTNLQQLLIWD